MYAAVDLARITEQADRILNTQLFAISGTPVTAVTLLAILAVMLIGWWFARVASVGVHRAMRARGVTDIGTLELTKRLVRYVILLLVLGVGLQTVGLDLTVLFAAGAFFAIAAGFAMQNIAQNFVAGFILMADRTIRTGDVLNVEGRVVTVTHMGLRATIARTRDEEDLVIPNSVLVQNTVTNYTLRDRNYRIRALVGVTYDSDMDQVMRVLGEAAGTLPWRVAEFEPRVLLTEFGDSSVNFEVNVWTTDPWASRRLASQLNLQIWRAFHEHGIVIAFPQLDLHLDAPVSDSLSRLSKIG
jgi:potassium-dependent mechanosensitive channel